MKEMKLFKNWFIGWYPMFHNWGIVRYEEDSDTDVEIGFGSLQIVHYREGRV